MGLLIISTLILIGYSFVFVGHLDYFLTNERTTARIIDLSESSNEDGVVSTILYYNKYKEDTVTSKLLFKYSFAKKSTEKNEKEIEISYTKWLNDVYLNGENNPAISIFIWDLIVFGIMYLCVKASIKEIYRSVQPS